jgi:hypothetical protein
MMDSSSQCTGGGLDAIITDQNLTGLGSMTVDDGEFVELTGDCTWNKVG